MGGGVGAADSGVNNYYGYLTCKGIFDIDYSHNWPCMGANWLPATFPAGLNISKDPLPTPTPTLPGMVTTLPTAPTGFTGISKSRFVRDNAKVGMALFNPNWYTEALGGEWQDSLVCWPKGGLTRPSPRRQCSSFSGFTIPCHPDAHAWLGALYRLHALAIVLTVTMGSWVEKCLHVFDYSFTYM